MPLPVVHLAAQCGGHVPPGLFRLFLCRGLPEPDNQLILLLQIVTFQNHDKLVAAGAEDR